MPSEDISRNYQFAAEILLRQNLVPLLLRPHTLKALKFGRRPAEAD